MTRFDDRLLEHPKFQAIGTITAGAWFLMVLHANAHRTDGWVGIVTARAFAGKGHRRLLRELAQRRLVENDPCADCKAALEAEGSRRPFYAALYLHNFLEHQRSAGARKAAADGAQLRKRQQRERERDRRPAAAGGW